MPSPSTQTKRAPRREWLLFITALIKGTGLVVQRLSVGRLEPFTFIASRFLVGGLSLLLVLALTKSFPHQSTPKLPVRTWLSGAFACGAVLFFATSLQQYGVRTTTAGKAGFITALYVVIVPLLGLFLRRRPKPAVWIAVAIALVGLYLLTMQEGLSIASGDLLVLLGAFFWSVHILLIDHFTKKVNGFLLSFGQFLVCSLIAWIAASLFNTITLEGLLGASRLILYSGLIVVGLAYTLQVLGQKGTQPAVISLILCLESVFGVLAGWLILKEQLTLCEGLGCLLVLAAVLITQLAPRQAELKET